MTMTEPMRDEGSKRGSLTERTVQVTRQVLAGRRGGLAGRLAFVGPAVIASIAYIDPGNFATNIQAGAKYGYQLLWVVLAANIVAMLFQALSAKLGIVTGRNLAEMCREQFPRPVVFAMWVVSEIAAAMPLALESGAIKRLRPTPITARRYRPSAGPGSPPARAAPAPAP
jgi:manganese transport protein